MMCWECKNFEYDEIFDEESGDETQIIYCKKDNDIDDLKDYKYCKDFEIDH